MCPSVSSFSRFSLTIARWLTNVYDTGDPAGNPTTTGDVTLETLDDRTNRQRPTSFGGPDSARATLQRASVSGVRSLRTSRNHEMGHSLMAFKQRSTPEVSATTPEKLFPLLPRTGANRPGLWSQQTDLLREYASNRVNARDLAVELPTGTGKTLTGLLIADWRRREKKERTVFACPTVQLVRQVVKAAQGEGIPVVDLSGSHTEWDPTDKASYERGRATAVVAYNAIFNVSPKLIQADVIVFDDAHAGEQYVSKAYTVEIARKTHPTIYSAALEAISPALGAERYNQLIMNEPGAGTRQLVDGVFLAQFEDELPALARALEMFSTMPATDKKAKSEKFAYAALKGHLGACTLYVSWAKMELRPATPPTFENALFSDAKQRVYLSATLGASGELERAFGRPSIKRLVLPPEAPTPKAGRRFLVFPHLVPDADPDTLTKELLAKAKKAIAIAPSDYAVDLVEKSVIPDQWRIYRKSELEKSLDGFAADKKAVALLANRYDGIDLPNDTCRAVLLAGFPGVTNLQEQFYASRARARAVSEERVRSRVVQGTGRCTRGPGDWALVIIGDAETTTYLSRTEVQDTLTTGLAAEVIFGLDQSEASAQNVRDNVDAFLAQNADWRDAESEITEIQSELTFSDPPAAGALAEAARYEVEALERMWHADWQDAANKLHEAAAALNSHRDTRGYQATLLFRAAVLMDRAARGLRDDSLARTADGLAAAAVSAATPATWMNAFLPFTGRQELPVSASLATAASLLATYIDDVGSSATLAKTFATMFEGLSSVDHKDYEPALTTLGKFLGADAFKPTGDGRTDSAWCYGDDLWLGVEAKSEHQSNGVIGIDDVRQVNGHLKLIGKDRGKQIPSASAAVMVSPRTAVKRDAMVLADEWTYRVTPEDILSLGREVERLWVELHTLRNIKSTDDRQTAVLNALRAARLTPEDVRDRLTVTPLNAGTA